MMRCNNNLHQNIEKQNIGVCRSYQNQKVIYTRLNGPYVFKSVFWNWLLYLSDDNYNNIWFAGSNTRGGCGVGSNKPRLKKLTPITYFNKHGIKIKKISVNISGHSGDNYGGQLGIASKKCMHI